MKRHLPVLLLLTCVLLVAYPGTHTLAQCIPMTAEECPDPENNGEICPDSLADGFLNQFYSQVATILAPLTDTNGIPLHHLTLKAVDNLPTGMTWQSNAANDEFLAGNYYCILMEGTPSETGVFKLKIIVDVYVNVLGFPILALTVTDSTSLAMEIIDNTGIPEGKDLVVTGNYPNPFSSWTSFSIRAKKPSEARLELYNLQGQMVAGRNYQLLPGEHYYHFEGANLPAGAYFYVLKSGQMSARGVIIRQDRQ